MKAGFESRRRSRIRPSSALGAVEVSRPSSRWPAAFTRGSPWAWTCPGSSTSSPCRRISLVGEAIVALEHAGGLHGEDALLGRPGSKISLGSEEEQPMVWCRWLLLCSRGDAVVGRWRVFARLGGSLWCCFVRGFLCAHAKCGARCCWLLWSAASGCRSVLRCVAMRGEAMGSL